jgi:hypothetical protein
MADWIENHKLSTDSAQKIVDEIGETIKKFNVESDTKGKSTTGKNSLQYELLAYIENFQFTAPLTQVAENTLRSKGLLSSTQKLEICSLWSVFGGKGTFHRVHRHNRVGVDHYSMVVYAHADSTNDETSGAFFAVLNDNDENDFIEFAPETGDILMFPVWICHGTYPQQTEKRITLNLDFKIVTCS